MERSVAVVVLVLALAGCAGRGLTLGGVKFEPGSETVYVLAEGDADRACRRERAGADPPVVPPSARVARCSFVGSSVVCADDDVPCRPVDLAPR